MRKPLCVVYCDTADSTLQVELHPGVEGAAATEFLAILTEIAAAHGADVEAALLAAAEGCRPEVTRCRPPFVISGGEG